MTNRNNIYIYKCIRGASRDHGANVCQAPSPLVLIYWYILMIV